MLKPLLAGATAIVIAGSSLVYAQQAPNGSGAEPETTGAREQAPRSRMTAEDMQAFADARVAALKAGLKLTAEQEKNWPAVETAIRDLAKARMDRMNARREARRDGDRQRDPIERLRQRADRMAENAAGLKKLADASEPLYKSLDDAQKRRLMVLTRQAMRGGHWRGGAWSATSTLIVPAERRSEMPPNSPAIVLTLKAAGSARRLFHWPGGDHLPARRVDFRISREPDDER